MNTSQKLGQKLTTTNPKPLIMGILNLTPDSFSDGGKFNTLKKALKRAEEIEKEGADLIDLGAESTGPGSKNVSAKEESDRLLPILKEIKKNISLPISVDTYKSLVAKESLEAGAAMINDVTGLRGDPQMVQVISKYQCLLTIMYSKDNSPRTTIKNKSYQDIISEIKIFFKKRISHCLENKIKKNKIILDPGMGHFLSANPLCSFEIIARLNELTTLNHPLLIGISRKSFLGGEIDKRDEKAKIPSIISYLNGAKIFRTHDVKGLRSFFDSFASTS